MRFASVLLRKFKLFKASKKLVKIFNDWKTQQNNLPAYNCISQKLLLIRLDDIGDYLVFRNFLHTYKTSPRFSNYEITLLGNCAWKDLFDIADKDSVHKCIWINKNEYFNNADYRTNLWIELRRQGFEIVICASRTRRLLLDDLCATATGAKNKIGSANTTFHKIWNEPSDDIYTELFYVKDESIHEFYFNKLFAKWCCNIHLDGIKLSFPYHHQTTSKYIICFIGVSTKSRQWPAKNLIEVIQLITKKYDYKVVIAGSKEDENIAAKIAAATNAENLTGKTSLPQLVNLIGNAAIVITNDTLAAHIGVACNTKTIILSNGNNYYRFTEYEKAGFKNVVTLYSKPFSKALRTQQFASLKKFIATSKDISSISAAAVLKFADELIKN